ncbi:MAG: D-hexose-6-phosphate mutarotase [Gemmatirosa sp.]
MSAVLPTASLRAIDGARAEIALHGAHVLSWRAAGEDRERLFLSPRSAYGAGASIRGGVPVIFPQFSLTGPLPRHGFARNLPWMLVATGPLDDGRARATLRLVDSEATHAVWPQPFVAEIDVTVGGATLEVALTLQNVGDTPLSFTGALHTYLHVDDVGHATLEGLRGVRYRDAVLGSEQLEQASSLAFPGEIDRIYLDVTDALTLRERAHPVLDIGMSGFADVVVWNPGPERTAALADMEPDGWRRMLCVEAACVAAPVVLDAGARWRGAQRLTAR